VKTLHRAQPIGRPVGRDKRYSRTMTLVEERVVLLEARSFGEAIRRGEAEARRYARRCRHRNPYGQQVRSRYLGYCDVYVFDDLAGAGTEVFSTTEVVPRGLSDQAVLRRVIGRKESLRAFRSRRNILDIAFNAPAPGVALTRKERVFVERRGTLKRRADA
jgi:Domain of unknown function (DUF4288)